MSLEIAATITNKTPKPNESIGVSFLTITPADTNELSGVADIGTSEESVAIPADIANNGYLAVINLDPTNYVQFGTATGVYWAKLLPGNPLIVPLDPSVTSLFFKADTATCKVKYKLYESE